MAAEKCLTISLFLASLALPGESRTSSADFFRGASSQYLWKAGEWGSCYAEVGCGDGRRNRPVYCYDTVNKRTIKDFQILCDQEKPIQTKSCFVACRHHKDHLEWRVDDWGPCQQRESNSVGRQDYGIMFRNVSCILAAHEANQMSRVVDDDNCLMLSEQPPRHKECSLPLRQDCVLTDWSPWTVCCGNMQHRTRSVLVAPHYGGQPCPPLSEWQHCDGGFEEGDCLGGQVVGGKQLNGGLRLRVDKWGECSPRVGGPLAGLQVWDGDSQGRADTFYKHWPQVGLQTRTVTCLNSTGAQLHIDVCLKEKGDSNLPLKERACIVAQDCVVSEWSDWNVIQEGCVDAVGQAFSDDVSRVDRHKWLLSKWSACTLPDIMSEVVCGGGLQLRNITCISVQTGRPLPNKACFALQPPPTIQRCEVACPRDCEVGPWGEWGPCLPLQCPINDDSGYVKGHRKRSRAVITPPSALGVECPSLTEVQPCPNPQCYKWTLEPWGSCVLDPGNLHCGTGTRTRNVFCTTHQGETVVNWLCTQMKPPVEEKCLLPCPFDCVVSGWSSWSSCSQQCSSKTKMAFRQRNRTVIAPPGQGGHPCPNPDEMLQMESCNSHGCHGYSWRTLPWQACNATCDAGDGIQTRDVWCVQDNQYQVANEECGLLPKPVEWRTCTRDCAVECELSPWSEWSPCPVETCAANGTRLGPTTQSRYRVVVEGNSCQQPLQESRDCLPAAAGELQCPRYTFKAGLWSQCQLSTNTRCGHGLRTRDLWCSKENSDTHEELRLCLKNGNPVPMTVQRCHVDCHLPCQLTEWSSWSQCFQPCTAMRIRTRQLIGACEIDRSFIIGNLDCNDLPLLEKMACPCEQYYERPISDWSTCITNDSSGCGTGMRYRAFECINDKEQMVDPSMCGGMTGLQDEPCLVSCPVDCQLSEWSSWGSCNVLCGPGLQNRTRTVTRQDSNGGRACGALTQWKLCRVPCSVFQWQAGGWSECILIPSDRGNQCGEGDQYRQVACIDTRTGEEVSKDFCDWTTQPSDTNACHVACPGDCVLSSWSEWSLCPKNCLGSTAQQRTRSLLRAASNIGAQCPHKIQTQACQLNQTCFTYHWAVTPFSSCLPLGGSPCGEGMTTRAIYCQRSDLWPVEDSYCSEETKPGPAEKWCYVDCPVDCKIAEWSDWNATQCQCGDTGLSRHAFIGTNPSSSGRPCPSPLLQWKACPAKPCYSWTPGPWTPCQLHGATCGHGVRNRNVSCVRVKDNTTVEAWHCANTGPTHRPIAWETCHVACDSDCQLSEWSHWSHCHGDCFKDMSGYATRSRAVLRPPQANGGEPCPEALWETKTCDLGPCLTFDWVITPMGEVVCQRSDGIHVVGGCDEKKKPDLCKWKDGRCVCVDGAIVQPQTACQDEINEVQARLYIPEDNDLNIWMFAMIAIGFVFIIFVVASVYILCNSARYQQVCDQSLK
ncbi:LOW QUALITY PROTEIN: thrombospondin type-1 domain-containing protein 7A [Nilaparvata lugens]|uniref:LOW QUALITY PROTEIN: thrombospondin type-1 domain-containing protein 7A n=1 Tax=Nilaparvata lugens TaxID=108931 RepID=UPI00193CE530|nr:LOW QUALITY PROTEIN: thrombospondin type-1 domain-containing protein 7A [Nilaparvata lugens]